VTGKMFASDGRRGYDEDMSDRPVPRTALAAAGSPTVGSVHPPLPVQSGPGSPSRRRLTRKAKEQEGDSEAGPVMGAIHPGALSAGEHRGLHLRLDCDFRTE
jgi:hypothetical protein